MKEYEFKTPELKEEFDRLIAEGYDPSLADMHVHHHYPGIKTNATVTRGMTTSSVYLHQLGCEVDTGDYLAHIKRICKEKNLDCEGSVQHQAREVEPTPRIPLASDLVDESIEEELLLDPSKARLPRQELVELVTEKYGSPH